MRSKRLVVATLRRSALYGAVGLAASVAMVLLAQWWVGGEGRLATGWAIATTQFWLLLAGGVALYYARNTRAAAMVAVAFFGYVGLLVLAGLGWHMGLGLSLVYWLAAGFVAVTGFERPAFLTPGPGRIPPEMRMAVEQRAAWVNGAVVRLSVGMYDDLRDHLAKSLMERLLRPLAKRNALAMPSMDRLRELERRASLARELAGAPTSPEHRPTYKSALKALFDEWERA